MSYFSRRFAAALFAIPALLSVLLASAPAEAIPCVIIRDVPPPQDIIVCPPV